MLGGYVIQDLFWLYNQYIMRIHVHLLSFTLATAVSPDTFKTFYEAWKVVSSDKLHVLHHAYRNIFNYYPHLI